MPDGAAQAALLSACPVFGHTRSQPDYPDPRDCSKIVNKRPEAASFINWWFVCIIYNPTIS
jgi:hypothetical protein